MSDGLVVLIAVLANAAFWFCMFFVQDWESRTGRIPVRTKDFPYMQDFWTNGPVGDLLALSLIDLTVAMTVYHQGLSSLRIGGCLVFAFLATCLFYKMATLPGHKPDWGFLETGITWGGRVHLVYFFSQVTVALLAFTFLVKGQMEWQAMVLCITGMAGYAITIGADIALGRFSHVD